MVFGTKVFRIAIWADGAAMEDWDGNQRCWAIAKTKLRRNRLRSLSVRFNADTGANVLLMVY
jgi:hypothetical protein